MPVTDLIDWLDEFSGPNMVWYAKRLSGNDTLANKSHQAGPYLPKEFLFRIFPLLNRPSRENPDAWFDLYIDSHTDHRLVRAVWYNNRLRGGTRNETRLTNLGGTSSALLDPESTGALSVFAFQTIPDVDATVCHVWVSRDGIEEDLIEERIGPVEPGDWVIWPPAEAPIPGILEGTRAQRADCWLEAHEFPAAWLEQFPPAWDIVHKAVELRPGRGLEPDRRLMQRRDCEFRIFRSLEEAVELPAIRRGFASLDDFVSYAQTVLQRRRARAGRSLELHTREIFLEERLVEGTHFSHQPESEVGKRPDFLFPSAAAYRNRNFPQGRLRMLAVKTTCRDRWRQILNEADRIPRKHLLTLQEGISEAQFGEMTVAGVQLVIPSPLISAFPKSVQPHLQTFESFIGDVRVLGISPGGQPTL